jgi:hypothetical protein
VLSLIAPSTYRQIRHASVDHADETGIARRDHEGHQLTLGGDEAVPGPPSPSRSAVIVHCVRRLLRSMLIFASTQVLTVVEPAAGVVGPMLNNVTPMMVTWALAGGEHNAASELVTVHSPLTSVLLTVQSLSSTVGRTGLGDHREHSAIPSHCCRHPGTPSP